MPEDPSARGRVMLLDFAGRRLSLPCGAEAWEALNCGGADNVVLLLGLGPGRPESLPFTQGAARVFWLDEPHSRRLMDEATLADPAQTRALPTHWREVSPQAAISLAPCCAVYFYRPGLRLRPDFWGPLLGSMDALALSRAGGKGGSERLHSGRGPALLPGTERQLLHQELRRALRAAGFGPVLEAVPPCGDARSLAGWRDVLAQKPALLLSVNLRGLDPEGRIFHLCQALNVPVALWFVDNPCHLLTSVRLPWWREATIFVTDAGFMPILVAAGARRVFHLPLAAATHMWRDVPQAGTPSALRAPPLFVGRSAFPERKRFFAAARVPRELEREALDLLARARGPADAPHFFWWLDRLRPAAWPSQEVRCAGLGAEICARANRVRWLKAALNPTGAKALRLVGDAGWRDLLPGVDPLPPVDYYATLPTLYAGAEAVLNVTSLLMPQSLSQRHFDVWAAGGLLLSDATPGLGIFPQELTRPMILRDPQAWAARLDELRLSPAWARDLRMAWRQHLRAAHGYEHRVARMCEILGI